MKRPRHWLEDNMKVDDGKIGCKNVNFFELA
jgi:hypothetical protein